MNTVVSSSGNTGFGAAGKSPPFTDTFMATASNNVGPTGNASNVGSFPNLYSVPNGPWTLVMQDRVEGDFGVLTGWAIEFNLA